MKGTYAMNGTMNMQCGVVPRTRPRHRLWGDHVAQFLDGTADEFRGHEIEHLLISLLAAGCGQRDDLLMLDSLDQAEPQLRGLQFESTPYDLRVALALTNCVAKGYDSPGPHRTRVVLEAAGVTDWGAFLREFVAPIKTYPVAMAMFSPHTDYR